MKIAHISDLHLLALDGATPLRLMNKRITGFLNLKLRRAHEHHAYAVRAVARAIRARDDIDHVVITGDLTNLSLDSEFDAARTFLKDELALDPSRVSIIPGNHDVYTRGAYSSHRFERYFAEYISTDLPGGAGVVEQHAFPYVRLRGPAAIIGLSRPSATPAAACASSRPRSRSDVDHEQPHVVADLRRREPDPADIARLPPRRPATCACAISRAPSRKAARSVRDRQFRRSTRNTAEKPAILPVAARLAVRHLSVSGRHPSHSPS